MRRSLTTALVFAALLPGTLTLPRTQTVTGSAQQDTKIYGETRRDVALVYIYRHLRGLRTMDIFCDDRVVGSLRRNDTYTFAYVAPGTHVVWTNVAGVKGLFDFASGQTYFLYFDIYEVPFRVSLLPEGEGLAIVKKAAGYVPLTDEQRTRAAATVADKWPGIRTKQARALTLAGGESVYVPPTATEKLVQIAAGTAVAAELMENLDSRLNRTGDSVWLRITEDHRVGGNLFVRAGTPVRALIRGAKAAGHGGKGGELDLTVVSMVAADGTTCPLVGQLATTGAKASVWPNLVGFATGGFAGGIVVSQLRRGAESFHPAGETLRVFTRQDVWIKSLDADPAIDGGAVEPSGVLTARARNEIICDFGRGQVPQVVEMIVEGAGDVVNAELVRAAGWTIPTPVRARRLARVNEGWVAQFGGWDIVRFLRPGGDGTSLGFRLTASDGTVAIAHAVLRVAPPR